MDVLASVVLLASLLSNLCLANETTVLNLMLITSGGGQYNSSGVEPAVDLAVRLINENDVIPGYQLKIASRGNSSCDRTTALSAFLKNITVGVQKVAVLGCGCSIATEAVAEISSFWNITQLSYASSSDVLSNREKFPNFWRTHTRESSLALSLITVMKEYNWTTLKIITQEENIFTQSSQLLTTMLEKANISVVTNGTYIYTRSENVTDYFTPEVRIYFLNMYSTPARHILCAAALKQEEKNDEFFVPGYVWLTLGWYRNRWWTEESSQDIFPGCNDTILKPLLSQTIGIQQANSASDVDAPTNVILTASEFKEQYMANLEDFTFEPTSYYAYDAVWSFAFAVTRALENIANTSFDAFTYFNGRNFTENIQQELNDTGFDGVSGYVNFDNNGTRVPSNPQLIQYTNGNERNIFATVNKTSIEYIQNLTKFSVWKGFIPLDGTPNISVISIKFPLLVTYYVINSICILFAIACLIFNIVYRKRKVIRLNSPNLNYIIVIGAVMLYMTVFFFTISSVNELVVTYSCHLRMWLLVLGYFSCFGTIVVKIWRVYYIFQNLTVKRKKSGIKDWQLFLVVLCICGIMALVMVCVAIFGDYKATTVPDKETPLTRNETTKVLIMYENLVCAGPYSLIWIFFCYGCVILTQLFAVFLAFRTRKVPVKALNDSKYLTIIIYTSSVVLAAMMIGAVLLDDYLNSDAAAFGGLIMVFTTVVLGFSFIPKMIILYKDPKGDKIFDRGQSQGTLNLTAVIDKCDQCNEFEKYITELEIRLQKHEAVVPYRSRTRSSSVTKYSSSISCISPSIHTTNPLSVSSSKLTLEVGINASTPE